MRQFTDGEGREWDIAMNIGSVKRVRALLGQDMLTMIDDRNPKARADAITRFTGDLVRVIDIIFVIVKPQADDRGVTDEKFAEAIFGDSLLDAYRAYMEELVDFFPSPDLRNALKAALERVRITIDNQAPGLRTLTERIRTGQFDEEMGLATHGPTSTDLPESSESPTPTP